MTETAVEGSPALAGTPVETRRKTALYVGMVGGVIALDQLTRMVVLRARRPCSPVEALGGFFRLALFYNAGAASGLYLGSASRWVCMGLAAGAVVVLWMRFRGTPWRDRARLIAIASVTGGAIGNVIDR